MIIFLLVAICMKSLYGKEINYEFIPAYEMGCMPSMAKVQRANGNIITVDKLQIGDAIMIDDQNASHVFHLAQSTNQLPQSRNTYLKITTADGILQLSPSHYLYVNGHVNKTESITNGDTLTLQNGKATHVKLIEKIILPGAFSPHTLDGHLIVDGFRTITHYSLLDDNRRSFTALQSLDMKFLNLMENR